LPDGGAPADDGFDGAAPLAIETTPGRVFFNEALPEGFAYVNDVVGKRNTAIGTIVEEVAANFPKHEVAASLDRIKDLGFRYAAQSRVGRGRRRALRPRKHTILGRVALSLQRESDRCLITLPDSVTNRRRRICEIGLRRATTNKAGT